jgi:hypothetical protein
MAVRGRGTLNGGPAPHSCCPFPLAGAVGYNVLKTSSWSLAQNYAWLDTIIASGISVVQYPGGSITAIETAYLVSHWYVQVGHWLFPGF